MKKTVIIIGAGPAGLSAGLQLSKNPNYNIIIYEQDSQIGGISKTIDYKGNKIDIGGHRFFTKNDKINKLRDEMLPLQGDQAKDYKILKVTTNINPNGPDPEKQDNVMLIRNRISRIYYLRKFFDYPVSISKQTIKNLGLIKIFDIGTSYIVSRIIKRQENNLEDFFINKFGKKLYETFFKDYTKKVWGRAPINIQASWGAQRIKGLSLGKALRHAISNLIPHLKTKEIHTSLIDQFKYPKFGPGQMREQIKIQIEKNGGKIITKAQIVKLKLEKNNITEIGINENGELKTMSCDYVISSMPIKDLLTNMVNIDNEIKKIGEKLEYRDFITVGILVHKLKIKNQTNIPSIGELIPDNWIYIQEKDVKVGRLQIFNNWSPYMIKNENTVWLGMEYFCNENDRLWNKTNDEMKIFAAEELEKIGIINKNDIIDATVIRVQKAYPAYFGYGYDNFDLIKNYLNKIDNLICIGRNGMHKYNNMDHSMLTGIKAADMILENNIEKNKLWKINSDENYHEENEG